MNSAVRLLDEAAERYKDKPALSDSAEELSFKELRSRSLSVGTALIYELKGSEKITPVIVYLNKSVSCIVSFMGVLYSGNPYVPVAADMPLTRIEKIVENLEPGFIITDAEKAAVLKEKNTNTGSAEILIYDEIVKTASNEEKVYAKLGKVIDTDPIYIMYTSGSTGVPKGVTVTHKGVIDYARWGRETFGFCEDDVFANQAPFYFDNSIFDIYGMLINGAKMIIIPEALLNFPIKLPEFLKDNDVTVIFWVPTVMINVANSGELEKTFLPKLKKVLFCGEVMPNTQLNIWRRALPDAMYANLYGPTEITDVCTYYIVDREFEDHEPLPIGKACRNMRSVIITEDNRRACAGEQGELCIIGTGVSLGYWKNAELTEKAFVQNPLNDKYRELIYKTGDLAYENEEGNIIFTGRKDNQIKIKGNRVELGEIEAAAMCVEKINNACALFNPRKNRIVLFAESEEQLVLRKVNAELGKYIPKYMLPGELVVMEKLPHTANDKINRVELKKSFDEENR